MATVGDRIKEQRAHWDLTLEVLGNSVGVSRQTIQRYESGVIENIPSDKLELLAQALQTTPAYLMGWDEDPPPEEEFIHMLKNAGYVFDGDGDSFHFETKTGRFLCPFSQSRLEIYAHLFAKQGMRAVTDAIEKEAADWKRHANPYTWGDEPTSLPSSQAVRINVYGSVHAGIPMEAQTDVVDWEEIPREWTAGGKEYFAVQVEGDCMAPKYLPKDVIIVRQTPDCESGQDVIVYVNGYDAELKRIHKEPDGITLQPLNSEYLPKRYRHNDPDHPVTVCGVVVEIRRKV